MLIYEAILYNKQRAQSSPRHRYPLVGIPDHNKFLGISTTHTGVGPSFTAAGLGSPAASGVGWGFRGTEPRYKGPPSYHGIKPDESAKLFLSADANNTKFRVWTLLSLVTLVRISLVCTPTHPCLCNKLTTHGMCLG